MKIANTLSVFAAIAATPVMGVHQIVQQQLNTAQTTWNSYFALGNVEFVSSTYVETINTQLDLTDLIDVLTDPDLVYISYAADPDDVSGTISLVSLSGAGASAQDVADYAAIVQSRVAVGQDVYQITWRDNAGADFVSYATGSANGIEYESVMDNMPLIEGAFSSGHMRDLLTRRSKSFNWIWGSERARVTWEVDCKVDGAGGIFCEYDCDAWMNIGDAQIECNEPIIQANCCLMDYGWGVRTPTGSITITWNAKKMKFEITITGIGSSAKGNGRLSDCCDITTTTTSTTTSTSTSTSSTSTSTSTSSTSSTSTSSNYGTSSTGYGTGTSSTGYGTSSTGYYGTSTSSTGYGSYGYRGRNLNAKKKKQQRTDNAVDILHN